MKSLLTAIFASTVLLLTACATNGADSAGGYGNGDFAGSAPVGPGGYRKTGKPYKVAGHWYYPLQSAHGYDETGIASWYGPNFHGHQTANGERYDMHAMSAAHKTLPMPTLVRVTNLENGRQIVVRVNDRGPFVKNRVIDLSYAAAKALGYDNKGTARVHVQALEGPGNGNYAKAPAPRPVTVPPSLPRAVSAPAGPSGQMYVQLGAFASPDNAERLQRSLQRNYPGVRIFEPNALRPRIYRVRIGPVESVKRVEELMLSLQNDGYANAIVVIE